MASIARSNIIKEITNAFILELDDKIDSMNPEDITNLLIAKTNDRLEIENAVLEKNRQHRYLTELTPYQIAEMVKANNNIVNIAYGGLDQDTDYDVLALYMKDGPKKGIYDVSEKAIRLMIRSFNYNIKISEINETLSILKDTTERKTRTIDRDLIAVNNGVFNYATKELLPFSSNYIFTSKSNVNYNPDVKLINIHNDSDGTDWDIESWMNELSDDPEIVHVLWEILGAIIRPGIKWDKAAWFYSEQGNNGKGTLCSLMRDLCGEGTSCSIPINSFSENFALEPLITSSAIIVDENDVGAFIDKAANLKAVVTNDIIPINRKYKSPISFQFLGFMVQCLNEYPKAKDKSDSFYRRQLFIPFTKCFTGMERRYIKHDYLKRKEVLEYVLHKVLNMNYYALSEPQSCKLALDEYKQYNDPLREFFDDMRDKFQWDFLPFDFLYALYKIWYNKYMSSSKPVARNTFVKDIKSIISKDTDWYYDDSRPTIGHKMDKFEPLILDYKLEEWMDKSYHGNDETKMVKNPIHYQKERWRGLTRKTTPNT